MLFSRRPDALGPLEPMRSGGKVLDFEEADPDTDVFGIGKVEDLTWKGMLDLGTCTECGRCQSQCPAWVTGKPLSPKQLILDLRDHASIPIIAMSGDYQGDAVAAGLIADRFYPKGQHPHHPLMTIVRLIATNPARGSDHENSSRPRLDS